jgi:hypothetical protein
LRFEKKPDIEMGDFPPDVMVLMTHSVAREGDHFKKIVFSGAYF